MHKSRKTQQLAILCVALIAACNSAEPPVAPDAVPVLPSPTGPMVPTDPASTGHRFVRTGYPVTGSATLAIANGVARLELSSDFTLVNLPGPVLYLNTTRNPNTGQPLRIGALRSNTGAQTYLFQVPANVSYQWIIIWCDPFNVPIAEASIPPTP